MAIDYLPMCFTLLCSVVEGEGEKLEGVRLKFLKAGRGGGITVEEA